MRIRKVLSVILALAMILTMAPVTVGSFAANAIDIGGEDIDINTAQSDELIRPNATVEVTPVTRVCHSLAIPLKEASSGNAVIIAATPSGIPKTSYSMASTIYAGETPVSTTIKFTPGADIDVSTLSITCSNSSVQFNGPSSPSAGVYEWTVKDGAAAAIGESLMFSVTYRYVYTDSRTGKTYNSGKVFTTSGCSYVESILSPAGIYSHRRTYISYVVGSKNINRSYICSALLGAGVYSTSTTTDAMDYSTGGGVEGSNYGKMLYSSTSGTDKTSNFGFGADSNRPTSTIYYDTDRGSTLAAQNIRFTAIIPQMSSESDQKVTVKLANTYEYTGVIKTYDSNDEEDRLVSNSNSTDLSLVKTTAASNGINTVGKFFTIPFGGAGPAGNTGTYTVILDFQTPGYYNEVYARHSHSLTIIKVNKGGLRSKILSVVNSDPTGPLVTDGAVNKGYNPQSWYYSYGWGQYATAYAETQKICNKPNATTDEISTALFDLNTAYDGLVLADADYTDATYYFNYANSLDESNYDPSTWAALERALQEYQTGYSILYQPKLDKITLDIKTAIENLRFSDADYTLVDEKVDEINGIMQDIIYSYDLTPEEFYTNWEVVTAALDSCGYYYDDASEAYVLDPEETLTKAEQSIVNGFPITLQNALNQLTVRSADYTEARTAISAYNSFQRSTAAYVTSGCLAAIEDAYTALYALYNPPLTIEYQYDIDDAVEALNNALNDIEYKDADFTAADRAIAAYNALERGIYTDLTAVDAAYQTLNNLYGTAVDARNQPEIDSAVNALNNAISKLKKNGADYTAVDNAIAAAEAENTRVTNLYGYTAANFYSNWSAVQTAINSVVRGLDVTKQSQVDGYASAITAALNALTEKDADYTALNNAILDAYGYLDDSVVSKYTDDSIDNLMTAIMSVSYGKKISEQAVVDGYTASVREAIANLELLGADYSAVTTAIQNANAKKAMSVEFADAHHGYPYYTAASIANLDSKINAVVYGLSINEQSRVNGFASSINTAVAALVIAPADYTDVNAAKTLVPSDLSLYTDASKAQLNQALAYNTNLKANNQTTVDGFATAICNAVDALAYKPIDLTGYNAAKATIPADLSAYTDASVAAVNNQISAINAFLAGTVDIRNQSELNAMVTVLNQKIAELDLKPLMADYTAVENAIAQANTLAQNKELYVDFSAVESAVASVVTGLMADEQARVDGFAAAINNAIAALAYKPIDTAAYVAAKGTIPADLSIYTDASVAAVNAQITAIDTFLAGDVDIRNQSELDSKVAVLNTKINALALKNADYTALNAVLAEFLAISNIDDYTNYDDAYAVYSAAKSWKSKNGSLKIDSQSIIDAQTNLVRDAIDGLQFKGLNTAAYDTAKGTIPADLSIYTDASIAAVNAQIDAIDAFLAGDVDIRDQADLDTMVATLNTKIAALALKNADYTALNAVLAEFLAIEDPDAYSNYDDAYAVYAAAKSWKSKNGNLKIDSQSLIDAQTKLVRDAIDGLLPVVPAGYFQARDGSTTIIASNKQITGLKTELTKGQLTNTFLDYDGVTVTYEKAVDSARYYGTGSTVTVEYADGTVEVYTIVIYGDIDGNGQVDIEDVALVSLYLEDDTALNKVQQKAANVDGMRGISLDDLSAINLVAEGGEFNQEDPSL